jgi:energy-coupling factor transporter ATP-binding protein EcfA2
MNGTAEVIYEDGTSFVAVAYKHSVTMAYEIDFPYQKPVKQINVSTELYEIVISSDDLYDFARNQCPSLNSTYHLVLTDDTIGSFTCNTQSTEMSIKITDKDLDFWIEQQLNVLFTGKHGTGKTETVNALFTEKYGEQGVDWVYFSAATMDPWVDFIGVPKEVSDEKGPYLDLIRPKVFRDSQIKALFFDELNRAHKKVRNAVMELIQFKSVNGRKFDNLEVVWAAVNPDDDVDDDENKTYDVEPLDPAQLDRFHVHATMPYEVSRKYFVNKYGDHKGHAACDWWDQLKPGLKDEISPRRLDYSIGIHMAGGNIRDFVLPIASNIKKLIDDLQNGSPNMQLDDLLKKFDPDTMQKFCRGSNNWEAVESRVIKNPKLIEEVFRYAHPEKQAALVASNKEIQKYVLDNPECFKPLLTSLSTNADKTTLMNLAQMALVKIKEAEQKSSDPINPNKLKKTLRDVHESGLRKMRARSFVKTGLTEVELSKKKDWSLMNRLELSSMIDTIAGTKAVAKKISYVSKLRNIVSRTMPEEECLASLRAMDYLVYSLQPSNLRELDSLVISFNTVIVAYKSWFVGKDSDLITSLCSSFPSLMGKYVFDVVMPDEVTGISKRSDLIIDVS